MGVAPKTVRDWIRMGRVRWRPRGNQGRDVLVTPDADRHVPGEPPGELDRLRDDLAEVRDELALSRVTAARAEAERDMLTGIVADLRTERDRLAAELAEARKPALVRLLEAFRRR
jgi:hypothetical protein